MASSPTFDFPTTAGSIPHAPDAWLSVARLCREVAVLRGQQRDADASALEAGALHDVVSALRREAADPSTIDSRLAAVLATERDRVANAAVLAQLLAPQVAALLSSATASPSPQVTPREGPVTPAAPSAAGATTPSFSSAPAPAMPRRTAPAAIADFIDEMIALERVEPGPARRAS